MTAIGNGSGFVAATLALGLGAGVAASQSWPQWGGPGRDFKAEPAARIATSWPAAGPRELWSRALGEGYSGIATDGTTLFTLYRPVKGIFTILAERVWSARTAPEAVVALDPKPGARYGSTPTRPRSCRA